MADLSYEKPTEEAVDVIAASLRESDLEELRQYDVWDDDDAIRDMVRTAGGLKDAQVCHINDEPVVLFGLQSPENFWEPWTPWLFASSTLEDYPLTLHREALDILAHWRAYAPVMQNYVWEGNETALSWLKRCGFYFDPARYTFGPNGGQFVRFLWRDLSCVRRSSSPLASPLQSLALE